MQQQSLNIEHLKKVTKVYCHGHCPDGLASAMIIDKALFELKLMPEIVFLDHGTQEHYEAGRANVGWSLFCDISPSYRGDENVGGFAERTLVLDHHVGTKDLVKSFGERGVYADAELESGVSGAVLAYRHVFKVVCDPDAQEWVGEFATHIGIRDTWQTTSPKFERGQWISQMLMSKPAKYWLTEGRAYLTKREEEQGKALFEVHRYSVDQAVDQCVLLCLKVAENRYIGAHVFQEQSVGFRLVSDVAESIRVSGVPGDIVVGFSYVVGFPGEDPKLCYSLRSLNDFDVCAFAKANGGGGHKAAAGFSIEIPPNDPYDVLRGRLVEYLRTAKL